MRMMTDTLVRRLYLAYKEVYELCDMLQIDGIVGSVRRDATHAKNDLYVAWQSAVHRIDHSE